MQKYHSWGISGAAWDNKSQREYVHIALSAITKKNFIAFNT